MCWRKCLQRVLIGGLVVALLSACTSDEHSNQIGGNAFVRDVHSFSRPWEVVVTHLDLDISVDFEKKEIRGRASLRLKNFTGSRTLYLDTRDMVIERVTLDAEETPTTFTVGNPTPFMGAPLIIDILPETQVVHVDYHTLPQAAALQWLSPEQTANGKYPFLFTQSQPILARSWIPCQDSPGIRMTYTARVKVPPPLMAVMSARNQPRKSADGVYRFDMPQPIPPYLLALAVGDLTFRALGSRSGVYAQPGVVEKAAWEFADTEKMIQAAEGLYGPYRWERYDILVLSPSFPFGGMENPRLTFATPTILAGDRSLVALIAHELAHSWSGNLVTNATWNDFWLNEGFTTYFERRIMELLYGKEYMDMLAVLGFRDLEQTIRELGADHPDTRLYLDLKGRDPDEAITDIPYEKGYFFLRLLEEEVGRNKWDAFLRKYFETFAFRSMTTQKFEHYLKTHLLNDLPGMAEKIRLHEWLYEPGLPENCPRIASNALQQVEQQVQAFLQGTVPEQLDTRGWTTHHWLYFIRSLPEDLSLEQMAALDRAFKLTRSGNSEILSAWLQLAVTRQYRPAYAAVEKFLLSQGRRKFLRPLYQKLATTPEGKQLALRIYRKARPMYHAISRNTIDAILGWHAGS
ncbi:MAG: M1 family metallopeptidase [Calditrichaeota bacterium]|nr:M1 family metallopeptidase [Calditrichota bacterium]